MNKTGHSVLIIDDDPDIGLMIKMMLEYKGYSVVVTERAEKAEQLVKENHPDLIIMDMLLSGINGTDVCATLKKDPSISHTPIIMISAHPNAKTACLEAGANDFISKPFDMQDILSKIAGLINSGQ